MGLGAKIKQARTGAGLTLEGLAKKMRVTRQLVWQWEHEESDPRKHIGKLSAILEIPVDYFYGQGAPSDPIEAKMRRLLPHERTAIEAAIDGILAQRGDAKKAM